MTVAHALSVPRQAAVAAAILLLGSVPAEAGLPERHIAMMRQLKAQSCVSQHCAREAEECGKQWSSREGICLQC